MGWWKIGSKVSPDAELSDVIQAFIQYTKAVSGYAPNTLAAYLSDLIRFVRFIKAGAGRPARLDDFSSQQVQAFLRSETAAGLHPRTVSRRLASLSAFNQFLKHTVDLESPLPSLHPAVRVAEQDRDIRRQSAYPLTLLPAHLSSLWATMEQAPHGRARRDQALLALLLETGLPPHRLLALNLDDLQDNCRTLLLVQPNGSMPRLDLDSAVHPLRLYLKEGRPELSRHPDEPALWISQSGRRMTRQAVWQVLRVWSRRAGLPFTVGPRMLSDTAAQRLAVSGLLLQQIQLRLGHQSSLSTLARLHRLSC